VNSTSSIRHTYVEIPAHRVILAARCSYFQRKFCGDWKDGNDGVAKFEDF
jgi:hypothetical protein